MSELIFLAGWIRILILYNKDILNSETAESSRVDFSNRPTLIEVT